MMQWTRQERGLTLTELVLVIALAGVVTLGLVTFYFNSQSTWVDASTQALTQREATQIVATITDSTHRAQSATVIDSPDALHQALVLHMADGGQWTFWWNQADSLIHQGVDTGHDRGPLGNSKVERFELDRDASLVYLKRLQVRSANGQQIPLSSTMALINR
jgi:Tfp pilus assembly protein FimT